MHSCIFDNQQNRCGLFNVIDNLPIPSILINPDDKICLCNQNAATIIGLKNGDIINHYFEDVFAKETNGIINIEKSDDKSESQYSGRFKIINNREKSSYIHIAYAKIAENKCKILQFYEVSKPHLNIHLDEKQREKVDDKFKQIVNAVLTAIIQIDKQYNIIFFNEYAEVLFEYTKREVLGKNALSILLPERIDGLSKDEFILRFRENPLSYEICEIECTTKSGRKIWVQWHNERILGEKEEFNGMVSVGVDITEKKNTELELRRLHTAIEQSPTTIVITDTKGIVEYVNPQFTRITGYLPEDVIGKNLSVLKSGHTKPEEYKQLWDTILSGNTWKGEFLNKKKDKSLFWEAATIAPIINEKGIVINYVAIKEDVTDTKNALEALQKSEQNLREANATKDKFFSIIAHDLKNPFNALIGFSGILKRQHDSIDSEKREKFIDLIHSNARNAYNLLENLLTWSQSQRGKLNFAPVYSNLINLVETAILINEPASKNKQITISKKYLPEFQVFVDKEMINTVLRNIISNAVKFTMPGGIIEVSVAGFDDSFIKVDIRDNGVGISEERLSKIFSIDKNVSTIGTASETGTGLGLILCKEFVEKNGGTIWAQSVANQGTTFSFTVPTSSSTNTAV